MSSVSNSPTTTTPTPAASSCASSPNSTSSTPGPSSAPQSSSPVSSSCSSPSPLDEESLRAQLALLPQATTSEKAYAQLCQSILDSLAYWRNKSEADRKRADASATLAANAINKFVNSVNMEAENALSTLRLSAHLHQHSHHHHHTSHSPVGGGGLGLHQHASSFHAHTPHSQHLNRRVSFNRDVVMVVSPEIGHGDGTLDIGARIDDEDDPVFPGTITSSSHTTAAQHRKPESSGSEADGEGEGKKPTATRRLSRTEFNEGAILKQHLNLNDLEKEELSKITG